ncbi:hypothetical protein QIS74_13700 [Colletotrichum tabaci]|uniref:Uncharacterized protein n=1 Tax=Colletotrichum tabaci TaxID=1209068 RepID=A0AAV9SSU5_9PEZI
MRFWHWILGGGPLCLINNHLPWFLSGCCRGNWPTNFSGESSTAGDIFDNQFTTAAWARDHVVSWASAGERVLSSTLGLLPFVPPLQHTIEVLQQAPKSTNVAWEATLRDELDDLNAMLERLRYLEDVVTAAASYEVWWQRKSAHAVARLGSAVDAVPELKTQRERFPDYHNVLVTAQNRRQLQHHDALDGVGGRESAEPLALARVIVRNQSQGLSLAFHASRGVAAGVEGVKDAMKSEIQAPLILINTHKEVRQDVYDGDLDVPSAVKQTIRLVEKFIDRILA